MNRLLATTSVALFVVSAPAWAEITPSEVWDHLVQQYQSMGYTVTEGGREEAGDTLTITDAKIAMDGQASDMTMTLPKVVMNQTGDGNVRWSIDGSISGQVTAPNAGEQEQTTSFIVGMPGNETVSSGSAEDLTHEFKADTMLFTMEMPLGETGAVLPLSLTLDGVTGKQRTVQGDAGDETTFESAAQKLVLGAKGDIPKTDEGGPGTLSLDGTVEGLAMSGRILMATGGYNMETQIVEALQAGTELALDMSYAGASGTFMFTGPAADGTMQTGDGSYSSGAGTGTFALSQAGMKYASTADTIDAKMKIGTVPFPISYSVAKGGFDLEMPVLASDQPAPFKLLTSITGLAINDELWGLFDPEAKLAHDPADLNIDITGDLLLSESILTPPPGMGAPMDAIEGEATAEAPAEAPADGAAPADDTAAGDTATADAAEDDTATADTAAGDTGAAAPEMPAVPQPPMPVRVTLNDVTLKAVGAEAKLSGELTAPEGTDMMAGPVGEINGEFSGVNALLDTLAAMGLIPDEQMMGARMMLAMFAKPVEGDTDKLQTKLEFREGGSIFANGQQVK